MSESLENVLRRIETKFALLTREVEQLRTDRAMLARELHRVRTERNRLAAQLEPTSPPSSRAQTPSPTPVERGTQPSTAMPPTSGERSAIGPSSPPNPAPAGPAPAVDSDGDTRLTDADWDRLSGHQSSGM